MEEIEKGEKILAPKVPTEEKRFQEAQGDEKVREALNKKDETLINNMNKMKITSTDPVERWTSVKEQARAIYDEHKAVARVDKEMLEDVWEYFRPFVRKDKQKVVSKFELQQLQAHLQGMSDETSLLEGTRDGFRKLFERNKDALKQYDKLDEAERKQLQEAISEQRRAERDRLSSRLKDIEYVEEQTKQTVAEARKKADESKEDNIFKEGSLFRATMRVAVGMSGGVDSAVAAWLLKKRGFNVTGVYMINWDHVEEGSVTCPRTKDEADARRVCEKLDIPFTTVNFVKEYWNEHNTTSMYLRKMVDNYRRGRTVVPDIACNSRIKFEHLHHYVIENLGADFIATGHYASTSLGDFQEKRETGSG
ncbi:tRNA methyl transferase [Necator americanus]|uniref:tRNA methyl transferase n=1 Tax=Necator americanus TaxID=51031 RepID=W2T7L5_NECAM|nr:tRNA methyl transferase [Necator americanus]ETN77848.1 tRNA methyl transferase [Necator americanus]